MKDENTDKADKAVETVKADIIRTLEDIRSAKKVNRINENIEDFVQMVEDGDFLEKEFQLSKKYTLQYKRVMQKYQAFCRAYLKKVFLEFLTSEYDAEMMLFLHGFIQDFDINIGKKDEQYEKYWEHAHVYYERLNRDGKSKGHIIREVEKEVRDELSEILAKIMQKSNGKLHFAEKVFTEFTNNNIPEKLSLPITDYYSPSNKIQVDNLGDNTVFEKDEEVLREEDVSLIEPNDDIEGSGSSPADDICKVTSENTDGKNHDELSKGSNENDVDVDKKDDRDGGKTHSSDPILTQDKTKNKNKKSDEEKEGKEDENSVVKALHAVKRALYVFGFVFVITALVWPLWNNYVNNKRTASPDAPETENDPLAGAVSTEGVYPPIESFSILNHDIVLTPGHPKRLDIEIDPPTADISSLKFESTNSDVVKITNDGKVEASAELEAGIYYVDITIKIPDTECKEVVHVKVENPIISDDKNNLQGGGTEAEASDID